MSKRLIALVLSFLVVVLLTISGAVMVLADEGPAPDDTPAVNSEEGSSSLEHRVWILKRLLRMDEAQLDAWLAEHVEDPVKAAEIKEKLS